MTSRRKAWTQAYAIVRVDRHSLARERGEPSDGASIDLDGQSVTVKEIVLSVEEAMREVVGLDALDAGKSCS